MTDEEQRSLRNELHKLSNEMAAFRALSEEQHKQNRKDIHRLSDVGETALGLIHTQQLERAKSKGIWIAVGGIASFLSALGIELMRTFVEHLMK